MADQPSRRPESEQQQEDRERGTPSVSGDMGGGGPSVGVDLGRDGTSTPIGDVAGGGEPGSLVDFGEGTITDRDAIPTGGAGAATSPGRGEGPRGENAELPRPARDLPRTATDMVPGIPVGSGTGIDKSLGQPDTELGGGVAADTTPIGSNDEARESKTVRTEDKDRTTL